MTGRIWNGILEKVNNKHVCDIGLLHINHHSSNRLHFLFTFSLVSFSYYYYCMIYLNKFVDSSI